MRDVLARPGQVRNFWIPDGGRTYPKLQRDVTADVAVIGGGIVGITAARMLQQLGRRVVVLESRRVGQQVTGGSTAKVTSQHSLRYQRLQDTFGRDTARVYAESNQWALEEIARTVEALRIDCSFERRPAYVLTADDRERATLQAEAELAAELGLPARFADTTPLPLPAVGAVIFDRQAQFDPYAYLSALAADVVDSGGQVFEMSRVTDVAEGTPQTLRTEGGLVFAQDVILATNLPILDRGEYFARTEPKAHLVLAARVTGEAPDGMFITVDEPTHSMRWTERADGLWLVLTGPKFQPGGEDTVQGFHDLERFARAHFPVTSVDYRWWNEDYYSLDGMPYVGNLTPDGPHLYVATGFSGWGITNGVVAARILTDLITGAPDPWAAAFDSTRPPVGGDAPLATAGRMVRDGLATAAAFVTDRIGRRGPIDLATLAAREGRVVDLEGEQVAVSRDESGALHAVSAVCTHLGCVLDWNGAMQTWDCGCHGSCFSAEGAVLRGPAVTDLASFDDRLP